MKKIVVSKIVSYIIFLIMFGGSIYIETNQKNASEIYTFILSFPMANFLTNLIHELGHFAFSKAFSCRVTSFKIGVFRFIINPFHITIEESGLLAGNCNLIIKDNISMWKKHLILMGGVYSNIAFLLIALFMYQYSKSTIVFCVIICSFLNVFANGLYCKSPDRCQLRILKEKNKA